MVRALSRSPTMPEGEKTLIKRRGLFPAIFYAGDSMGDIVKCAALYADLLDKDILIQLENGVCMKFFFLEEHFAHLIGLHYLRDLGCLSGRRKQQILSSIKSGQITQETLERSCFYSGIEKRVEMFEKLPLFFVPGRCELIIEYDRSKVRPYSNITAHYILFIKEAGMYLHLPLVYNENNVLCPQSFFAEKSARYIDRQKKYRIVEIKTVPREKR